MIDFEIEPSVVKRVKMFHMVADGVMRPISRECDENEHAEPEQFFQTMWAANAMADSSLQPAQKKDGEPAKDGDGAQAPARSPMRNLYTVITTEELCWGDAGLFLATPNAGLGGAAVMAAGTAEQKERFLARFRGGEPKWGAMAITEPGFGSDSSQVTTTAKREGDDYILHGSKIFCTAGNRAAKSGGFIVVWATVDRSAGRPGIKPFVVEHGTPGMTVVRVEKKLGIRVSDTAAIVFDNCRIPKDHLLGSPEVRKEGGFKDVMATFDATRPIVAAMAIGVGRAALDFVRDFLKQENIPVRYGISPRRLTALERDFMEMEVQLKAARLLTWRAAWLLDTGKHNNLEASMAKAKAGLAVTLITQKAVELLGPLGYSRQLLLEKWMRDAKINDIFEGTQQINMLIVARRILGYSSKELN
jgi:acyl-CoA dehydrogenase